MKKRCHLDKKRFRYLLPVIIICILFSVMVFRWDYQADKSEKYTVIKWKTDRWTGQKWVEVYSSNITTETPANLDFKNDKQNSIKYRDNAWNKRHTYTIYWMASVGTMILWIFVISVKKHNNTTD
jgi:hypothetical protein